MRYVLAVLLLFTACEKPDPMTKRITITPSALRACTAPLLSLDNSEHAPCICLHEQMIYWEPCKPRSDEPCAP